MRVLLPELTPRQQERLAALDTFEQEIEALTEAEWQDFDEISARRSWFGGR